MTITRLIGQNLRECLRQRCMTVPELIQASGVSKSTVYRIIRGETMPAEENLISICIALDIDEMELVKGSDRYSKMKGEKENASKEVQYL